MRVLTSLSIVFLLSIGFQNCDSGFAVGAVSSDEDRAQAPNDATELESGLHFFGFAKAAIDDPDEQKRRAVDANARVSQSIASWGRFQIDTLSESLSSDPSQLTVNKEVVMKRLRDYATRLKAEDTIVIYSHSHGVASRLAPNGSVSEGGMLVGIEPGAGKMTWSEYANLILNLPAKNVIVFTMACYSGQLIEILNTPAFKARWENRRAQNRSFVVITAQNSERIAGPANIGGVMMNALPYAVEQAFLGGADGYQDERYRGVLDGRITFGELIYFALQVSRTAGIGNNNDSQLLGSFDPSLQMANLQMK